MLSDKQLGPSETCFSFMVGEIVPSGILHRNQDTWRFAQRLLIGDGPCPQEVNTHCGWVRSRGQPGYNKHTHSHPRAHTQCFTPVDALHHEALQSSCDLQATDGAICIFFLQSKYTKYWLCICFSAFKIYCISYKVCLYQRIELGFKLCYVIKAFQDFHITLTSK